MIHDLLKQLDFNEKERDIYLAVLKNGKITPAEVAKITRINRTTVYSVSSDLIKRGVIAEDLGGRIRYLVARPPEDLSEILRKDENAHEAGKFTKELIEGTPFAEGGYVKVKHVFE